MFVNGKYESTCNPDSNSCSKWYKCLETHLIDSQINDFITFQFNSNGNGLGCNRISFWTNVTLSCYIATDPTAHPTVFPTQLPTVMPSLPTELPTLNPTLPPTSNPSAEPSLEPTKEPSNIPTAPPTMQPTSNPSTAPSMEPTREPSDIPTGSPTSDPTSNPTRQPTSNPSAEPSLEPTKEPSDIPTATTSDPTSAPTGTPTLPPTHPPTQSPTSSPSYNPSNNPTMTPTFSPTHMPTVSPTFSPTHAPTAPNNILYIDLQQSAIDGHYNAYHLPLPIGVNASRGFVSFQMTTSRCYLPLLSINISDTLGDDHLDIFVEDLRITRCIRNNSKTNSSCNLLANSQCIEDARIFDLFDVSSLEAINVAYTRSQSSNNRSCDEDTLLNVTLQCYEPYRSTQSNLIELLSMDIQQDSKSVSE
eukprot:389704_1